ncbi:DsbA family protein [Phyllobacterium myrsinacearum]|uniref:Protein-disulfide isomerase n=1 Tax=Phyllobacterium myrsinacearum TaxID=28101 RepID=A0A839ET79_9HYPH|nr:DsbA family protein [Phyllobacterium myrsinacearum]MBA8880724.1 protein-disulfide isomerase [Phyllobacterium myrsinacearum]
MKKVALVGATAGLAALVALGFSQQAVLAQTSTAATSQPAMSSTVNRAEIEAIIKDYLLKNPEVLLEAQAALSAKQEATQQQAQGQVISQNSEKLFNSPLDAVFGNPKGDVTVVEFFDYNCGYCKRALPDMDALLKSDPNLRFVMKEFPILGPDSTKAHIVAKAFKALMPEKYLEFHRDLLGHDGRATEEAAMQIAIKLGGNEKQIREKMKSPEIAQAFQQNYDLANSLNINGTPSYIIGNEVVPGALGADALAEKISHIRNK